MRSPRYSLRTLLLAVAALAVALAGLRYLAQPDPTPPSGAKWRVRSANTN